MVYKRPTVLFLCTGNSCRSQMAEGWAKRLFGDRIDALSAGMEAHGLNLNAVAVMAEAGVDISGQTSNRFGEFDPQGIDLVVTVCSHADERCPVVPPSCRKVHAPFDDPPKLAENAMNHEQALAHYRRVRDEIREFVERRLLELLEREPR